jgi:nitrite reductase/ring-hydroxylating ferredoxin subunit
MMHHFLLCFLLFWILLFVIDAYLPSSFPCFASTRRRKAPSLKSLWEEKRGSVKVKRNDEKRGDEPPSGGAEDLLRSVGSFFEKKKEEQEPETEEEIAGGFLRFFRKKQTEKDEPGKEEMTGGFFGFFRRKVSEEDEKKEGKKRGRRRKQVRSLLQQALGKEPKEGEEVKKAVEETRFAKKDKDQSIRQQQRKESAPTSKPQGEKSEEEKSLLRRAQELIPFTNRTSAEQEEVMPANTTNPISVVQKFASNFFKGDKEEWVPVFPKTRISPGELVPVTVNGLDLLIVAAKDGRKLYGIANSCPHLGTPLETGTLTRLPIEDSSKKGALQKPQEQWTETDISAMLQQDGCEDCIVCPLHRTAFALESGAVRGEWCPYPPVIGSVIGAVKKPTAAAVFKVRTKGKYVEVCFNTVL